MRSLIVKTEINKRYLKKLDRELEFIPLTFDPIFKGVFGNETNLLKKFLLSVLKLNLPEKKCQLRILNPELPIETYKEYKKTVDFNIMLNDQFLIEIEINRSDFNQVKLRNNLYLNKEYSLILERGDKIRKLSDLYFYQLNLNTKNRTCEEESHEIVWYDLTTKTIYLENEKTILKYLEFYHDLYYTEHKKLGDDEIWLVALASRSFTELDEILTHILSEKDRKIFMEEVIQMNWDGFNIHEWEKEKCDELVRLEAERIEKEKLEKFEKFEADRHEFEQKSDMMKKEQARMEAEKDKMEAERDKIKIEKNQIEEEKDKINEEKDRINEEKGKIEKAKKEIRGMLDKNISDMILNMLNNQIELDMISKVTGKSIDEIRKIEAIRN